MAALLCVRQRGSQLAHAIRRAKLSRRKKWAVRGQRACTRAPPMGYYFASRRSIQLLPPGAVGAIAHRNSARVSAARHRLLLPAHRGRQPYQRALYHRLYRLDRSDFAHCSAGGSYMRIRDVYCQQRRHAVATAAGARCTLIEGGHAHRFACACTRRCAVCAVRAALQ